MSSDECGAAAAADGAERRDPSEKQEPHTVMWGKILENMENMEKYGKLEDVEDWIGWTNMENWIDYIGQNGWKTWIEHD